MIMVVIMAFVVVIMVVAFMVMTVMIVRMRRLGRFRFGSVFEGVCRTQLFCLPGANHAK